MSVRPPPAMFRGFAGTTFAQRASWASRNLDVAPTSWYRTPAENAAVGGDPFSQHLVGWALDVTGPGSSLYAKQARVAGLTAEVEAGHVHVQLFPAGILRLLFSR